MNKSPPRISTILPISASGFIPRFLKIAPLTSSVISVKFPPKKLPRFSKNAATLKPVPAGPVMPVTPVAPLGPVAPLPVGPEGPLSPFGPSNPLIPSGPVGPV